MHLLWPQEGSATLTFSLKSHKSVLSDVFCLVMEQRFRKFSFCVHTCPGDAFAKGAVSMTAQKMVLVPYGNSSRPLLATPSQLVKSEPTTANVWRASVTTVASEAVFAEILDSYSILWYR